MRNKVSVLCLSLMAVGSLQLPSLADDWFDHYDRDHDGHWSYNEFKAAHRNYMRHHHDAQVIRDAELRNQWNQWDTGHHGWVTNEQVRTYHHWD